MITARQNMTTIKKSILETILIVAIIQYRKIKKKFVAALLIRGTVYKKGPGGKTAVCCLSALCGQNLSFSALIFNRNSSAGAN